GQVDRRVRVRDKSIRADAARGDPPPAPLLDQAILIRALSQDLVAALRGQRDDRRAGAGGGVAVNLVEEVQGPVAASHEARVDLGILAEVGAALDGPAIELEDSVGGEAVGPAVTVLGIDRMAIAGA